LLSPASGMAPAANCSTDEIRNIKEEASCPSTDPTDPTDPRDAEDVPSSMDESEWILQLLKGRKVGETIHFPAELRVGSRVFTSAFVERDFRTASGAHLLRLYPGAVHFIVKFADVRQEHAMMCALLEMNRRWHEHVVNVCGVAVQALTYEIFPIGSSGGLIEAVIGCRTLRELKRLCRSEPQQRVFEALGGDGQKLNTLAASTTAYLTACYALGVRDGHDDNIMLREDGSLFRVDFGFVFGATPEIDSPQTVVARAVTYALGVERWMEVVAACGDSLTALTGNSYGSPPAYDCLSSVSELEAYLPLVRSHTASLSLAQFCHDVSCADQWSFSRAAKNTLREAVQFLRDQAGLGPEDESSQDDHAEVPEGISGAETPLSDPFLDLNLFLDSGVDLLGLYRAMPEQFGEHEGDLTDWFIEGPVADMLSMAKEGLSREDLPAESRPRNASFGGHLPQEGAQRAQRRQENGKDGDVKSPLRMKQAREMLMKLYEMTALQRKPSLPFPVDSRARDQRYNFSQQSEMPSAPNQHAYGGYPLTNQEWPQAASLPRQQCSVQPMPVNSLPVNDPFARTPPATPREPFPKLLEVLAPEPAYMAETFVPSNVANTYTGASCGMYSKQAPFTAGSSTYQQSGISCAGRSPEPLHPRVAPMPKMKVAWPHASRSR